MKVHHEQVKFRKISNCQLKRRPTDPLVFLAWYYGAVWVEFEFRNEELAIFRLSTGYLSCATGKSRYRHYRRETGVSVKVQQDLESCENRATGQ